MWIPCNRKGCNPVRNPIWCLSMSAIPVARRYEEIEVNLNDRLLDRGSVGLSDAELVALFIRTGTRDEEAEAIAESAIAATGGLRCLLDLSVDKMAALPRMGEGRAAILRAAIDLMDRYLEARMKRGNAITSSAHTNRFLNAKMRGLPYEVFACLFLDNRHRVIHYEEMFRGTVDGSSVYPREVVKRALELNAAAIICAHNHPSGVAEPSRLDRAITTKLHDALALIDVRLIDHLVIGDNEVVSFAERGML